MTQNPGSINIYTEMWITPNDVRRTTSRRVKMNEVETTTKARESDRSHRFAFIYNDAYATYSHLARLLYFECPQIRISLFIVFINKRRIMQTRPLKMGLWRISVSLLGPSESARKSVSTIPRLARKENKRKTPHR